MSLQLEGRPKFSVFFYFIGQYKTDYLAISAVTIVAALMESFSVVAFFPLFTSLLGGSQEDTGSVLEFISWMVELVPIDSELVAASALLITAFVAKTMFSLLRELLIGRTGAKVLYNAKKEIMQRHADAHYQYYLDNKQGTLIYYTMDAPTSVGNLMLAGSNFVVALLKIISITVLLFAIFPMAALAMVALAVFYYIFVHLLSKKISYYLARSKATAGAEQLVIANEFLSGFRQIVAFNAAKWWLDRFDKENEAMRVLIAKDVAWSAVPRPTMELSGIFLMMGVILVLWATSPNGIVEGLATVGVFAVAMTQMMPPLGAVGASRILMMATLPNAEIAHRTLTGPMPMRVQGLRSMQSFNDALAFEDVSFAHKDRGSLFDGLNLAFQKGTSTAIVGPSGVGKTTIINLILGFFEPSEGRITVDGVPLQDFKQESWLSRIGFVSQDPFIYNSSITDNIRFGREGHQIDSVIDAAKTANAHGFISELPQGYDTVIGDRGVRISGGQQQRLAIARAVLDTPDILVFDEATSSLDSISELLVQEAIKNVSVDRTVITIAHRLSTIKNADKIIVLNEGRVVEQGDHQELLNRGGHYSRLVESSR